MQSRHTIMSQSGEMNPWKRHIIVITKGFGLSFYNKCDWRTIMSPLIPSASQQMVFTIIMESPDQNRNTSGSPPPLQPSLLTHSLPLLHYITHQPDTLAHARSSMCRGNKKQTNKISGRNQLLVRRRRAGLSLFAALCFCFFLFFFSGFYGGGVLRPVSNKSMCLC